MQNVGKKIFNIMIIQKLSTDKTEIQEKRKQKQEFKLLGSIILKPGLTLWEFDFGKMELKKSEIQLSSSINFSTKLPTEKKKVYVNPNAYYYQCHNKRTAVKKANKIIFDRSGIKNYFQIKGKKILRKVVE